MLTGACAPTKLRSWKCFLVWCCLLSAAAKVAVWLDIVVIVKLMFSEGTCQAKRKVSGVTFLSRLIAKRDGRSGRKFRLARSRTTLRRLLDYLQLITARGRFGNRQEEVASISRGLKGLAKELQIPVLVLSQLTRAPERDERGPQLSDLRESGAIEQDADMVMFIYRPHFFKAGATPEEREETELRIAKQRNGPTDMVKFVFRSRFTRFEEAVPDAFSQFAPDDT